MCVCVFPYVVKTCAVRPVVERVVGELCAGDPSRHRRCYEANASSWTQSEAPRRSWAAGHQPLWDVWVLAKRVVAESNVNPRKTKTYPKKFTQQRTLRARAEEGPISAKPLLKNNLVLVPEIPDAAELISGLKEGKNEDKF